MIADSVHCVGHGMVGVGILDLQIEALAMKMSNRNKVSFLDRGGVMSE
jgi:hypothetical protein